MLSRFQIGFTSPLPCFGRFLPLGLIEGAGLFLLCCLFAPVVWAEEKPEAPAPTPAEPTKEAAVTGGEFSEWAAREKASELPRMHLDPQTTQQTVLSAELKGSELIWLDSPSDHGKFLGVAIKEASGTPQGAVVVIPDYGQHAQWPVVVKPLGELLPDKGWYVFSVSMPVKVDKLPPERAFKAKTVDEIVVSADVPAAASGAADAEKAAADKGTEAEPVEDEVAAATPPAEDEGAVAIDLGQGAINQDSGGAKSGSGNEFTASAAEIAGARVFAAVNYVKSKGYENLILLGYGMGAHHVMNYLEANKGSLPRRGFAVILIDAKFERDDDSVLNDSIGKGFSSPMLDLVNSLDLNAVSRAESRKRATKSLKMTGYQMVKMPMTAQSLKEPQSILMHRISGWLSVKAPGTKATKYRR